MQMNSDISVPAPVLLVSSILLTALLFDYMAIKLRVISLNTQVAVESQNAEDYLYIATVAQRELKNLTKMFTLRETMIIELQKEVDEITSHVHEKLLQRDEECLKIRDTLNSDIADLKESKRTLELKLLSLMTKRDEVEPIP